MSSPNPTDNLVFSRETPFAAGFAGIRASLAAGKSSPDDEIKVVVASPVKASEGKLIKFATKVTKHVRARRGWGAFNASVQRSEIQQLPPLGSPQQVESGLSGWIIN